MSNRGEPQILSLTGGALGIPIHTFTHSVSHEAHYMATRGERPILHHIKTVFVLFLLPRQRKDEFRGKYPILEEGQKTLLLLYSHTVIKTM